MLLTVISPAKKLDFETPAPTNKSSMIDYSEKCLILMKKLKKLNINEVQQLMKLSDSLAELNYDRFQNFSFPLTTKNAKQAMFAFTGDTYVGLEAQSFNSKDILYAQKTLRILSGLYGVIKPLDLISPYRLEMGTRFKIDSNNKNLYDYWKDDLTDYFHKLLGKNSSLINLASKEYFLAINLSIFEDRVITPQFKQLKDGELKSIGMMSKRARGMMASYIIKKRLTKVDQLQQFNSDGYKYSAKLSSAMEPVFVKKK
jgi:cytoplasmic iron level regulating protein YaaA (DUF328/UPF0246 family)